MEGNMEVKYTDYQDGHNSISMRRSNKIITNLAAIAMVLVFSLFIAYVFVG
jgi:hypothetical protein